MSAPGFAMPARRWGDEPKPETPRPIVLVSSRDDAPVPVVTGAVRLARAAQAAGWTARQTYALASIPATARYPARRLASVAVRLGGPKGRGWAVWHRIDDGAWRFTGAHLIRAGGPLQQIGARALMVAVSAP